MSPNNFSTNRSRNLNFMESQRGKFKPVRSLTRLVVGGAILGIEELMDRLETWEREIDQQPVETIADETVLYETGDNTTSVVTTGTRHADDSRDIRHILVGFIFDSQSRMERRLAELNRFERRASRKVLSPFQSLGDNRFGSYITNRFDQLVRRGESELTRLAEIGKIEEHHSRKLALTATTETVDSTIDYLTDNEELQELIASQGVGIAGEALEEVRERSVSADDYFESVIRALLRRKPRERWEAPSQDVRQRAVHIQPPEDVE
jgi:hypothetical protein